MSEVYYSHGWRAYVDEEETSIIRVNYALRGIEIPEGQHEIVFKFEPEVVKKGSRIALGSSIIFMVLVVGGLL